MGRRRFAVGDNGAVTFDSRCLRSDGRRWRCPMPALPNNIFCAVHRTPSTRRRTNAVDSPSKVSDSELPQPDPYLAAESDPEKVDRSEDPLPRRSIRKKKRKRENGAGAEASALDPCFEEDSDLEKLNLTLDPVEAGKKRARKENGADNEGTVLGGGFDRPIKTDSALKEVNQTLELVETKKQKPRKENGANSEGLELDHCSDQPVEADSDADKANQVLDPPAGIKKNNTKEKKRARKENGADNECSILDKGFDQPIETDSDPKKVNRTLEPVETKKQKPRKENGANSEGPKLDHSSDQPVEADLDADKANQVLDSPAGIEKNNTKENGAHSEPSTLDQNLDQPIEAEKTGPDLGKANQTLDTNKKWRRREKGQSRKREKKIEMINDKETDLIRMAMKRQIERKEESGEKKRHEMQIEEVRRELPNGVMAISSTPTKMLSNIDRIVDKKIGLGLDEGGSLQRRFRSKNAEPQPVGSVKKFPWVLGRSKNECGEKRMVNGTKKSCKTGKRMGAEDSVVEESANGQNKSSGIRYADYFISQLLPVLKQLNWEQIFELEIEANSQGRGLAGIQLQVVECSHDMQFKCNFCRISIFNLHRSCPKCHYKLCPSCCREVREERLPEAVDIVACEHPKKESVCKNVTETPNEIRNELSFESPTVPSKSDKKRDVSIPCPPSALGGCGDGVLDMKLLVPFGWTQEPCSTKQIVSNCDPEGWENS